MLTYLLAINLCLLMLITLGPGHWIVQICVKMYRLTIPPFNIKNNELRDRKLFVTIFQLKWDCLIVDLTVY